MPKQTLQRPDAAHVRQRIYRRDERLRQLGYASYRDYLYSSAWADVKRRYRAAGLPHDCVECGRGNLLAMHHKTYERVGEELLSDLMPLCWSCHGRLHDLERDGIVSLDFTGVIDEERALEGRRLLAEQAASRAADLVKPPGRRPPKNVKKKPPRRHADAFRPLTHYDLP